VVNDYAHHPTEIRATLAAARARWSEKRIWAVWQPHTYSRTQTLFEHYVSSFDDADEVIVTEIYAAREPKQDFTSAFVVSSMRHPSARFVAELKDVTKHLTKNVKPGDVVIVMSAGDGDRVSAELLARLLKK
jgi:UDP-N-acetylmuramate--alanine ligase